MNLVKITRERDQVRRIFARHAQIVEDSIKDNKLQNLDVDIEYLENQITSLSLLDKQVQDELFSKEDYKPEDGDKEWDQCEKYKERWLKIRGAAKKRVGSKCEKSPAQNVNNLKLPKIEIRKFDDNPKSWLPFWGQFKKINDDPNLDNEDKFQYLIQSMEIGSNARNLVESYPPTKENYVKIIELLKTRFARDEILIEIYVRELLKLVVSRNSISVDVLYDKVIANLQTLETLGVMKDKYECILFPLVESALPESTLLSWSRIQRDKEAKLSQLLEFLKLEMEAEDRLKLAKTDLLGRDGTASGGVGPTAACLFTSKEEKVKPSTSYGYEGKDCCYFCEKPHNSAECSKANKLTLEQKKEAIKQKGGCYVCLKKGHLAKHCKCFISCLCCKRRHMVILCPTLHTSEKVTEPETKKEISNNYTSNNTTTLLQTLVIKISHNNKEKKVRALLDSGSQRTYIKAGLAEELGLRVAGSESVGHSLFGGMTVRPQVHRQIEFKVSNLDNTYQTKMQGLEQSVLCGRLPKLQDPVFMKDLQKYNINLTDTTENISEISILIGSDYLGGLLESDLVQVKNNLTAIKTKLGWTLQGPIQGIYNTMVNSHFVTAMQEESPLEFMWDIETLGIKDPYEKELQLSEMEILKSFNDNVSVNSEGRYEVGLMWKLGHPELQSNYDQAYKRLISTTNKLENTKNTEAYHEVFQEWIREGIIEKVEIDCKNKGHYLPHHAVVKMDSSTTKIRPVFDASSKDKNNNSLNSCIEKGPNLIELIPKLLILFRAGTYGVISDIKKAFLQISVCPQDRENLKMLWWEDPYTKKEVITYQHARVPFGVACSPFLLAATINLHLGKHMSTYPTTAKRLKESFYVDNCVTSFDCEKELLTFISEASDLMKEGQFDLRGWMSNREQEDKPVPVLGLLWNRTQDDLQCHINIKNKLNGITKRDLLSITQQVFDPLGILCSVTLVPKLIMQKAWLLKTGWDERIPKDLEKEYMDWLTTLHYINDCRVPRRLTAAPLQECETSIHVFSDASKDAFAGCVFLRTKHGGQVTVQLITAKSRVAPIKRCMSLPRLELMGALVASRLFNEVMRSGLLSLSKEYKVYCWTDSSVVLAWLKRQNTWKTFINNRVKEICTNTNKDDWNHLPGIHNPADLPSRGCTAKTLLEKRWWMGPQWLQLEAEHWPKSSLSNLETDEEIISSERIKNASVNVELHTECFSERLLHFNQYSKIIRLVARLLRMSPRIRKSYNISSEYIQNTEYKNAEKTLIRLLQKEHFQDRNNMGHKLITIEEDGILKVKTRLEFSTEDRNFIYPILLPGKEEIVQRMVQEKHKIMKHAGTQLMMATLRDSFWILGIRRLAKKVVAECITCKRFKAKHYEAPQPPLPTDRIQNTAAFSVTGIDLAGPLILKNGTKCWIVLYTCAVYRAVHLELTESLSTASFIMTLRRFIARRGRVSTIYTDNGTNFVGTANLLREVNWQEVETTTNSHGIQWKFSVPLAPWWGGWWERLIRVVKEILRRILGKSVVDWIELSTILCDCEMVVNSRPLTYVEMGDVRPLTPMMFLHSLPTTDTPDLDQIDHRNLNTRYKYLQQLREDFRHRFKTEYLALLINKGKEKTKEPKVGEIVLVETDSSRINWPLGIIKQVFTGKDGVTRVARVLTATGERLRAYQRLYPLEISAVSQEWLDTIADEGHVKQKQQPSPAVCQPTDTTAPSVVDPQPSITRSGRTVKLPLRFLD